MRNIKGTLCVSWPEFGGFGVSLVKSIIKEVLPSLEISLTSDEEDEYSKLDHIKDHPFDSELQSTAGFPSCYAKCFGECIITRFSPLKCDYHFGTQLQTHIKTPTSLKIAIIGFGNVAQFLAKAFVSQGHTVLAHSRSDHSDTAAKLGVSFFNDPHDLCEEHPEVVMLCTSILSTKSVLESIPFQRLRRSTLFVDVLSVKEFPRSLFLEILPEEFDILCTHPMLGPESGKKGWAGLPFMYDKVRIGNDDIRISRSLICTMGCPCTIVMPWSSWRSWSRPFSLLRGNFLGICRVFIQGSCLKMKESEMRKTWRKSCSLIVLLETTSDTGGVYLSFKAVHV
ncbi:unnamed protein product, partial [Vitis vinifera]